MLHVRHVNIVTDGFRQNFVSAIVSVWAGAPWCQAGWAQTKPLPAAVTQGKSPPSLASRDIRDTSLIHHGPLSRCHAISSDPRPLCVGFVSADHQTNQDIIEAINTADTGIRDLLSPLETGSTKLS